MDLLAYEQELYKKAGNHCPSRTGRFFKIRKEALWEGYGAYWAWFLIGGVKPGC